MTTVTVDYDDLQTLLFATNAIQGVEAVLKARERDPLVLSTKGKLSAAHDRLADAWRKSKREAPPEPDERDIEELRRMFSGGQTEAVVGPREVVDEREELIREIVSRPNRLPSSVEEAGPPGKFHRTGYLDQSRAEITVAGLSEPNEYPGGPLIIP